MGAKRILVVDDHPGIVAMLRVAFRVDGGRFTLADAAGTAAEGLARFAGHDAVVLDMQLPDAGGPDLVQTFRDAIGDTPLVIHTAGADMYDLRALEPLVDAVVVKGRLEPLLDALATVTGAGPAHP